MADSSDGEQSSKISFSSMKQPPLIKQLKGILSEYPDGGQILKELIQNAEDANATVVEIEYDNRKHEIVNAREKIPKYAKFFLGSSLCVYNNAVFTEKDWEGIRMIYSSVKEDDRLTVGRFGLGFKSVFHITDYPCVLSGDTLLMIDPQQSSDKVNAMVKLSNMVTLQDTELPADTFRNALMDKFGLTGECIKKGYFAGTIFRFPLRESKTELSETLYDTQKVFDLFDDFKSDSSTILLFLKNLEKVNLTVTDTTGIFETYATVEILDPSGKVRKLRQKFKKHVTSVSRDYKGEDIVCDLKMSIRTSTKEASTETEWIVVNNYVGSSASPYFRKLIEDENLGYSPYVGVAAPLKQHDEEQFEGHVFCFLPLPKEGTKLTGLPVHVNGYFALSQNRHHIKQETDEQRNKKIDDKSILWNRHLITEALPKAYYKLILNVVKYSIEQGNTTESVNAVYHCWPLHAKTLQRWQPLENEVYKLLKTDKLLYVQHKDSWIPVPEACFATFSSLSEKLVYVTDAVKRCMTQIGLLHVDAPLYIFETLKHHYKKVKDVRPDLIAKHMHRYDAYKTLNSADKLDVLTYLLSDKNCYPKLSDLELLPLVSGQWTSFTYKRSPVYSCDEEVINLLPGLESRLLMKKDGLGKLLAEKITQICDKDYGQLKRLRESDLVKLIESTIVMHLGETDRPKITDHTKLTVHWIHSLWSYLCRTQNINAFRNVPIVPKLTIGTWVNPQCIELVRITDTVLIKSSQKDTLSNDVVRCFQKFGVTVVDTLPNWIPEEKVKSLFFWPSITGVLNLLEYIFLKTKWQDTIDVFNSTCNENDKKSFVTLLSKCTQLLNDDVKKLIRKLNIFSLVTSLEDRGRCAVLDDAECFILDDIAYPKAITLPKPCIKVDSATEQLVTEIGGIKKELQDIVMEKLTSLLSMPKNEETLPFMHYITSQFHIFQENERIVHYASQIPFLRVGSQRYIPGELFDPSDSQLAYMLYDEGLIPETNNKLSKGVIRTLQCMGLRTVDNVDADILLQVAKSLDKWSKTGDGRKEYFMKASALMAFLMKKPSMLQDHCQTGFKLHQHLTTLECIIADKSNPQYPACLTWYTHNHFLCTASEVKESSLCLLVGASMPTITCTSNDVNKMFGWTSQPDLEVVFQQLQNVKDNYSIHVRPDILPSIKALYAYLHSRVGDIRLVSSTKDLDGIIWTGEGFRNPDEVVITKQIGDLDLTPYFHMLPEEFDEYYEMFLAFGCRPNQNIDVLQDALHKIQELHGKLHEEHIVKRDQRLVCSILDTIASKMENGETVNVDKILVLVHNTDKLALEMRPLQSCVYDDDPDFFYEDTEDMFLVHAMLSSDTVETLGIKSITKKSLLDAEGLGAELCEQRESLTSRIHSLLRDGYTDGLSVPKELIQNADDAGATTIKFMYDERQNSQAKQRVFSRGMASFQGPALWVYNDAQFSQLDMENITKLNGATKQCDVQKIGKFGLGFCSVYNLTDIPSFLTRKNIVFFDPHENHLGKILGGKKAGLKYTLPNRTLIARHTDQFKPYNGVFGCDVLDDNFETYRGTLFRLPLRTEKQAKESKICSKSYTNEEMKTLIEMIIKNAGNMLLFSQNVCSIELYHLPEYSENPKDATLIYTLDKECFRLSRDGLSPIGKTVLSRIPELLYTHAPFLEVHKCVLRQQIADKMCQMLLSLQLDDLPTDNETTWITSWALGSGSSLALHRQLTSEGAVPLASVAIPCSSGTMTIPFQLSDAPIGFYTVGHLFCFLPLPIKTNLQMQINGCFSVTSDRRQLISISEDDKDSLKYRWNEALLKDAVVKAHVHLLETMSTVNPDSSNYNIWPLKCGTFIDTFTSSFYERILSENPRIFKSVKGWECYENVCFIESSIRGSNIGDIAFEFLSRFNQRQNEILVDIPESILYNIRYFNWQRKTMISLKEIQMEELLLIFLENIHDSFWVSHEDERLMLIEVALDCREQDILDKMRNIDCIPTEPYHRLRKPSDLIHPNTNLAKLFVTEEECFPLNRKKMRTATNLQTLIKLGMCENILTTRLLTERCKSVLTLSEQCSVCAVDRIRNIVQYLSQYDVRKDLENKNEVLQSLSNLHILPVLPKPSNWQFSWKADDKGNEDVYKPDKNYCQHHCQEASMTSLVLAKPSCLFRANNADLIGTKYLILNESLFSLSVSDAFNLLFVRNIQHVSVEMMINQLLTISGEYSGRNQFNEFLRLHDTLMSTLDKWTQIQDAHTLQCLAGLSEKAVVLIGDELVKPNKVAFHVKQECKPFLYRLPEHDKMKRERVYFSLGVKERFDFDTIIEAMDELSRHQKPDLTMANSLLCDLEEVLQSLNSTYEDKRDYHERLVAPDTEGRLWPTYQLVTENENFQTGLFMKVLHPSIAPSLGESLGVKVKKLRCFEEISCGIAFGQREKLVTRIQGLLKSYPCDSSIMKELLQNADDAGATEIHFIKDYRSLSRDNLFSDTCEPMQGPSLCVYNNSFFTESDIEGIHNLGKGSKSDDPSRTGQYGVGFNAVYHLTDTPSFVTVKHEVSKDGQLFIFDPLCKHVPKATLLEPGMMCPVQDVKANFPGQLLGFSLDTIIGNNPGTVFRFPLRVLGSDISANTVTPHKMDEFIKLFIEDMQDSLIFLKNIHRITVSNISSGNIVEEHSVQVKLSENNLLKKKRFTDDVRSKLKEHADNKEKLLEIEPIQITYPLKMFVNGSFSKCWIVVQRFGVQNREVDLESVKKSFRFGDLGLSPIGGVALPISPNLLDDSECIESIDDKKKFTGRAFCFLPLPIDTGLPVHVNGHFALDHESRRDLWTEGFRMEWNKCVIEHIVIPAWVSGLKYMAELTDLVVVKAKTWREVNDQMFRYHTLFPVDMTSLNAFWKFVAATFYKHSVQNEYAIFPSVLKQRLVNEVAKFDVSWETINSQRDGQFHGVFNTIASELNSKGKQLLQHKECLALEALLKYFGLKLLQAPMLIHTALTSSGLNLWDISSPDLVLEFVLSHSSKCSKTCEIGLMDTSISNTKFKTIENLKQLIQFILLDSEFCTKIEGLPILLTADGVLRKCSKEYPVFISEFANLVANSADRFLHSSLLELLLPIQEQLFETGCFRRFTFEEFVDLLPNSIPPNVFANGKAISVTDKYETTNSPSLPSSWLCAFYDFLCIESEIAQHDRKEEVRIDNERLLRNMTLLGDWSLVPCTLPTKNIALLPIDQLKYVLYLPIMTSDEGLKRILEKLEIPRLSLFSLTSLPTSRYSALRNTFEMCVASPNQPYILMKCLLKYRDVAKMQIKSCLEGKELLNFFGRSIDSLKKECNSDAELKNYLKQLPFYTTLHETLTSLDHTNEILVLPSGIPKDGIQEWANACTVTLLQAYYNDEKIRQFLGLTKADVENVYSEKILPNIRSLPKQHLGAHVKYLRKNICGKISLTPIQQNIVKQLSQIAFIDVGGVMRRADDLYDPDNNLFKIMLNNLQFPPAKYVTEKWRPFLKQLGLISQLNDTLLLQFARDIERQTQNRLTEDLRTKSKVLLQHFLHNSTWTETTLHQLQSIRFIVPYQEERNYTQICPQLNNGTRLICFKGSVPSKHSKLCWSSTNLIPNNAYSDLYKTARGKLGVLDNPPVDSVILHCKNVCQSLQHVIKDIDKGLVEKQMESFYEFFKVHTNCDLSGLKDVTFVHLPEENQLVLTNEIVIGIKETEEIKPYVFQAPTRYGKYFDLFKVLESKPKLMFCHYAEILNKIYIQSSGSVLNRAERSFVQKALFGLFCLDANTDTTSNDVRQLYLPDKTMILKDSRHMVLSNNGSLENRLEGKIEMDIFAGNVFLQASTWNFESAIKMWPVHLRPKLLTELVTEQFCRNDLQIATQDNTHTQIIKRCLHSRNLVEAICRLLKHQSSRSKDAGGFDAATCEKNVKERLQRVNIVSLPSLRTILTYNDIVIAGTEADIPYHIEYESKVPKTFYFVSREGSQNWITSIVPGLIKLVIDCVSEDLDNGMMLPLHSIMLELESPNKFSVILDNYQIKPFNSQMNYFPEPGTYVERQFIPFLEQGIEPFNEYEYDHVAMELEDIPIDGEIDTLFIYVRILAEVKQTDTSRRLGDLGIRYYVYTGNKDIPMETIPIYRLYRFVRRQIQAGALELTSTHHTNTKPFDEHCARLKRELMQAWKLPESERKRVFRRLLLDCHPDKHRDAEEYYTKVFQYLKIVHSRLENGELLVENIEEEIFRGPSRSSQSTQDFYRDIDRRASKQAQGYHENLEEYTTGSSNRFSHRSNVNADTRQADVSEANRWLRQAKGDFTAAKAFLSSAEDAHAYNWICKICHQACETALKAAHYFTDRRRVPGMGLHRLKLIAPNSELAQQAGGFDDRFGDPGRLTYPDTASRPDIPSNLFDRQDAEFAIETTKQLLETVDDYIA